MQNAEKVFSQLYYFTGAMNSNDCVTLKSDSDLGAVSPNYRICANGTIYEGSKVAVKCNNFPQRQRLVEISDVITPRISKFNKRFKNHQR